MQTEFWFTFGLGHHDKNNKTLGNKYTIILAKDEIQARQIMAAKRADKWCYCYNSFKEAGIEKYELQLIQFQHLESQEGPTR